MSPSPLVLRQAALCENARRRISPYITQTPCIASREVFDDRTALFFKAENFQHTGSFKYRGALSKLTSLDTDTPVITASSGNHGLALAAAAQVTGHKLSVVLPTTVAKEKLAKIQHFGVETLLHSEDAGAAEKHAQERAVDEGAVYVSPYNDETVIAGQGTIALELLEQVPNLDVVFVSMGGGGLISGIGSVIKTRSPGTRLIGVSARNSAELAASIRSGESVSVQHSPTLADGCAGSVDEDALTLDIASQTVDELVDCSEVLIAEGVRALAWDEKMLVEGSAGLALAAWRSGRKEYTGLRSAVVLCGANFDKDVIGPVLNGT